MNHKTMWLLGIMVLVGVAAFYGYTTLGLDGDKMSDENKLTQMDVKIAEANGVSSDPVVAQVMMNQGDPASEFSLLDTNGNKVTLSDLKGERVYIKFWASWCSICLAGLEESNTLAAETNDFKVITIVSPGFKGEQSQEDFLEWFKGIDAKNLTVLLDPNGDVATAYGIRAYPTSFYIGSDGVLAKTVVGHNGNELIKEMMEEVK